VNIFSTYIQTDGGLKKIVPNDNIWKSVIVNQTTGVVKNPTGAEPSPPEARPGNRVPSLTQWLVRPSVRALGRRTDAALWIWMCDQASRVVAAQPIDATWVNGANERRFSEGDS
jgi:hypothetical protein